MGLHSTLFVHGDLDLWPLTFKLVRAREQTCLPCEFGANAFSGSRDVWVKDSTKNRILCSLLHVV